MLDAVRTCALTSPPTARSAKGLAVQAGAPQFTDRILCAFREIRIGSRTILARSPVIEESATPSCSRSERKSPDRSKKVWATSGDVHKTPARSGIG